MIERVLFSFHYERDLSKASYVRSRWLVTPDREVVGFWDPPAWESIKAKGEESISRWIAKHLEDISVTIVLIGAETSDKNYITCAIKQSYKRKKGLLAIYIHDLKDLDGNIDRKGKNPLNNLYIERQGHKVPLSTMYSTYDWIVENGDKNLETWIKKAARDANLR